MHLLLHWLDSLPSPGLISWKVGVFVHLVTEVCQISRMALGIKQVLNAYLMKKGR